jgi:hypothetical protein
VCSVFDSIPQEDCVDCLEDIDDARDCLRECNEVEFIDRDGNVDGSLLANCLDPSRSGSEVESLDELVDCCDFDRDCENDLEDVQDCLSGCLDSCISDFAEDYLECIQDEAGSRDCDLGECIDGFLNDDIEDELSLDGGGKSNDLFSVKAITKRIENIEDDDLEDCELMADFVDSVCDVGEDCCDRCQEELGLFVDCLVNDIVIPFVSLETNTTILSCPIDTEDCELDSRSRSRRSSRSRKLDAKPMTSEEQQLIATAFALPSINKLEKRKEEKKMQSQRNTRKEDIIAEITHGRRKLDKVNATALIAVCESKMRMDVIASNMTNAMNVYMECVAIAAIQTLEASTPSESGSSAVSTMAALVVAMVGSMIAFF